MPRDQLFITTKLWNNKHHPDDVAQALQDSLNDLDLEYVDLFLMHWPVAFKRGTEKFPKNESGKPAVEDTDYVDVCIPSLYTTATMPGQCANLPSLVDIQSHGEAPFNRKGESHWRLQLLQVRDGTSSSEQLRRPCSAPA